MEIKITKDSHTINGNLIDAKISKFGNSCHIPIAKKHLAEKVKIIIPIETRYYWIFSELELEDFIEKCKIKIKEKSSKLKHLRVEALENLIDDDFNKADIQILVKLFDEKFFLIDKIRKVYLK